MPPDLAEVEARLLDFERRYEKLAKPFEWRFTRMDLRRDRRPRSRTLLLILPLSTVRVALDLAAA